MTTSQLSPQGKSKTNHNQNIVPGLKVENHVDGNANVLQGTRKWYLMAAFSVALMFILGAFWLLKTTLRGGPTSRNHWSFTALRRPLAKLTSRDPNSAMQFIAALKQQMEILSPPLQAHAVTARDIAEALRQKGVPEDLLTNLEKAIVNIETAPYRGEPIVEQHIESLKASMEQLLTIRLKA